MTLGDMIFDFLTASEPWVIPHRFFRENQSPTVYVCSECIKGRVHFRWKEKLFSTVKAQCNRCGQDYTITGVA